MSHAQSACDETSFKNLLKNNYWSQFWNGKFKWTWAYQPVFESIYIYIYIYKSQVHYSLVTTIEKWKLVVHHRIVEKYTRHKITKENIKNIYLLLLLWSPYNEHKEGIGEGERRLFAPWHTLEHLWNMLLLILEDWIQAWKSE